jgi:hypothetical protein
MKILWMNLLMQSSAYQVCVRHAKINFSSEINIGDIIMCDCEFRKVYLELPRKTIFKCTHPNGFWSICSWNIEENKCPVDLND